MKVGFLAGVFPPQIRGGAENYVVETATELQARGHDVFVITTRPFGGPRSLSPTREQFEGLPVYRFFPLNIAHKSTYTRQPLPVQGLWRLLDAPNPHPARVVSRIIDREAPDVVHSNNLEGISTVAVRAIQNADVRHVHTLHDYSLLSPNSTLRVPGLGHLDGNHSIGNHPVVCAGFARLQRALFGRADAVTGPSQHIVDAHKEYGFFRRTRAERLQLGAADVADSPVEPPEEPTVLYVGRMEPIKGVDTVLDAAIRMPDVTFHFCGTGEYEDVVASRAAKTDNVVYHGYVTEEKLASLRRAATMGVVPSVWPENSPLTVYESFAVGLPIVGSDVGGVPELVTPGETGALFAPGELGSLVDAIRRVADDPDPMAMRERALAWAREHTLDEHVDTLVDDIYRAP